MKKKAKTAAGACAGAPPRSKPRVRDRIFETASALFYRRGIRAVGVDAIASSAGTNKMSFYRSFVSKDALVADYLRDYSKAYWARWDRIAAQHAGDPHACIEALFASHFQAACSGEDSGCALGNAAVELRGEGHPGLQVVREHKTKQRAAWQQLARELGAARAETLGDGLMLLVEGSAMTQLVFADGSGPLASALDAARALIDSHVPGGGKRGARRRAPSAAQP